MTKEHILEEAIRLFSINGFDGTSIQSIADAVGIKKQSLLYYFGSKEDLREEIYKNVISHWKEKLPKLLATKSGGYGRFTSIIESLITFLLEDKNRTRLIIREILDRPDAVRKTASENLMPWVMIISDYIRMGQEAGIIKESVDPESYITQVIMMAMGTVAIGGVVTALVKTNDKVKIEPMIKELERIARESLFKENKL
ncbi:MAG: TetR/AcrR family transcriptional regulator [Desulfobacterales bacterium]|nr:TetR/AcrR family transcriptional regulator [Desulfobacterales bacterium]MBF0395216.1 TetR/AcrR family transcriptional regulator [Desulfobacterales bacterium]